MSHQSGCRYPRASHATESARFTEDELADDLSMDYGGDLDHAPAISHGTYLDGTNEGLEPLEQYQEGGYHPVHLGDTLGAAGLYSVIHRLGHGSFWNVWLCRDLQDPGFVAVKVMAGDVAPETLPDLKLMRLNRSAPGAEYIAIPMNTFSVTGPNGSHQCIVLPVLGPYFRPANILVKLANLNRLSEDELLSLLGQPEKTHVHTELGEDLPESSPRYLVIPADTSRLSDEYMTDKICVIDFGESFPVSSPPADLGIPANYLPPEILLDQENAVSQACDTWALGCTLFEIREQLALFYMVFDRDELLAEIVRFFGKPPQEWWDKWEARADFFDEQGTWLQGGDDDEWSLEVALSKPTETFLPGADNTQEAHKSLITPKAEQELMADLPHKLFRYEPGKRVSAEEVLGHEWFKM